MISDKQVNSFSQGGYLLLEQALPDNLLSHWQTLAQEWEKQALKKHQANVPLDHACVVQDPVGPRLMRYDDVFTLAWDDTLALLATPAMLSIAHRLCGDGAIPLQVDILYKHQHPHPVINWHQGAPHSRAYPYLNIGIYLDDAPAGDGCLRYVPGSQHELHDIQALSAEHGWDIPDVVEQPARAGDILVQDMMILHGSKPKRSSGCRRTIYIEIRPYQGVVKSGLQSKEWAELRKQWMALVIEKANKQDVPKQWFDAYPVGKVDETALRERLTTLREPPTPAVWATFPMDHPNYPVPADLREPL